MQRQLVSSISVLLAAGTFVLGAVSAVPAAAAAVPTSPDARADFNGDGIADLAVGVPWEDGAATADSGAVNVIYGTSPWGLHSNGNQVWSQDSAGIGGSAESADRFGIVLAVGDFDGDGCTDLAVGVPWEDQVLENDGVVNVIYGSSGGLTATGNQVWSQDSTGIGGSNEESDIFGSHLAAGDFDGDGYTDLAVSAPFEDDAGTNDGVVHVIYGSSAGLTATGNEVWSQNSTGIAGTSESGDAFGSALAAANFGRTTHADLAIGVESEDAGAGAVNVLYGSSSGLASAGNQYWTQDTAGIDGGAEPGDHFGWSLAAADLSANGIADLAIGAPDEDQGATDTGVVHVIYGTSTGLGATNSQLWSQDSSGIGGGSDPGDNFGWSLAAADFSGNGVADLAIGVPFEDQVKIDDGVVNVIYGGRSGLSSSNNQVWSQDSAGISDANEEDDNFGWSVAAANLGQSTHADLAVGVPYEDVAKSGMGVTNVIYGSGSGLASAGNQVWSQDSSGILDVGEITDLFGLSLAAG